MSPVFATPARAQPDDLGAPACGCITCGDRALAMRVQVVDADRGLALCEDDEGMGISVETALVGPVKIGDVLLVHAGTAIAHGGAA